MSWLFLDNNIVSFTVYIFHFLALVILIFLPALDYLLHFRVGFCHFHYWLRHSRRWFCFIQRLVLPLSWLVFFCNLCVGYLHPLVGCWFSGSVFCLFVRHFLYLFICLGFLSIHGCFYCIRILFSVFLNNLAWFKQLCKFYLSLHLLYIHTVVHCINNLGQVR